MKLSHKQEVNNEIRPLAVALAVLLLALPSRLFGYVDPGSGAFVYQALYAAFLGGIFYVRKFVRRLFRRKDR